MPELPDVVVYVESLDRLLRRKKILSVSVRSPFVVRTFEPDIHDAVGRTVAGFQRLGKRIVWQLDDTWFLVFHLMIAGRFHWKKVDAKLRGKNDLLAIGFEHGTMVLTEASQKKRAALHVIDGADGLKAFRSGGLEPLECTLPEFHQRLLSENHTLKRALTSPRLFSGIGNAYSDEILHAARLSPLTWTSRLSDDEIERLFFATQETLRDWTDRLRVAARGGFPEKVTAFRPEMATHGRYGEACPVCTTAIQRIRYADRETNYCPRCQNAGKMLADRSLSRLLKDDWPQTIDEWEEG